MYGTSVPVVTFVSCILVLFKMLFSTKSATEYMKTQKFGFFVKNIMVLIWTSTESGHVGTHAVCTADSISGTTPQIYCLWLDGM